MTTKKKKRTITVGELLAVDQAIAALMNEKLPTALAFRVALLVNQISPAVTAATNTKNRILLDHGAPASGGPIADQESLKAAVAELGPFVAEEVQVDYQLIPQSLFEKAPCIAPATIVALLKFIDSEA